jgi:hypothetical protein
VTGEIPLFFTLNAMQSISALYKEQLDRLIEQDRESQAKTKATLQRLRELIETVQSIELDN